MRQAQEVPFGHSQQRLSLQHIRNIIINRHAMNFGELKKISLRTIWKNEAHTFTPWLEENISALGDTLGMELELTRREANVGDFSLDLLARNLNTGKNVVIENQLTQTDHDHLGKLLTYAAGFNAESIIWVAESIRDEHRQALDWLNQHTDSDTNFFAITVEIFQIDESKPAYKFNPIVFPNEWQKNRKNQPATPLSPKAEAYRNFFQSTIDILREKHLFTNAKVGQPQNWYSFASGFSSHSYSAVFTQGNKVRVELYIDFGDYAQNKHFFELLLDDRKAIETELGTALEWEKLEDKRASRIGLYRSGSILDSKAELDEIQAWIINKLTSFKKIFTPVIKKAIKKTSAEKPNAA